MGYNPNPYLTFQSTKTYDHSVGLSACFRQWRAKSHCNKLHGYALQVSFLFEAPKLDDRNWVVDFGGLKPIKAYLEEVLDHKTVVAEDDPDLVTFRGLHELGLIDLRVLPAVGCEAFASMIWHHTAEWLAATEYCDRVILRSVEVREHAGNSAKVVYNGGF